MRFDSHSKRLIGRSFVERQLLAQIDHNGPMAASKGIVPVTDHSDATAIVVEASSPGFAPVQVRMLVVADHCLHTMLSDLYLPKCVCVGQVSIPVSTDPTASVMNVAQAGAGQPVDFFGHAASTDAH